MQETKDFVEEELDNLAKTEQVGTEKGDKICPEMSTAFKKVYCERSNCQMWDTTMEDCSKKNNNLPAGLDDFEIKEDKPKTFKSSNF
jgi:hypothetical protein